MSGMQIDIKKPSELSDGETEAWREFVAFSPELGSPYFALEFAECCEEARDDTRVIVLRREGRIQAFLPLQTGRIGYARPLAGPLGDVQGLICEPGSVVDLAELLRGARVPIFDFHSALSSQACFGPHTSSRDGSRIIDVSEGYNAWHEARRAAAPKAVRKLRQKRRRLEGAEGGFNFVMAETRPEAFETMLRWKRDQYRRSGYFDVFSVSWTRKLLDAVLRRQSDRFSGLCSSLSVNGEMVGVHVGMASDRLCHYWFPAYNPDYALMSPGVLMIDEMARTAAKIGHLGVELGPGEFGFKRDFSSYMVGINSGRVMLPSLLSATCQASGAVARGIEALPVKPVSELPGKAMRKIDRLAGFYAA